MQALWKQQCKHLQQDLQVSQTALNTERVPQISGFDFEFCGV